MLHQILARFSLPRTTLAADDATLRLALAEQRLKGAVGHGEDVRRELGAVQEVGVLLGGVPGVDRELLKRIDGYQDVPNICLWMESERSI